MQEHIMRQKVKSIRKIKLYSISLTLTTDNRGQAVEKCHQIGNCLSKVVREPFSLVITRARFM
jgi:hypothetical protein